MASPLIGIGAVNALLFAAYSKLKQIQNPFNDELKIWQIALAGAGAGNYVFFFQSQAHAKSQSLPTFINTFPIRL